MNNKKFKKNLNNIIIDRGMDSKLFFEEFNVDNMLYTKNHRDLYTLFFINKFMNNTEETEYKKKLKNIYKHQLDKKVNKMRRIYADYKQQQNHFEI